MAAAAQRFAAEARGTGLLGRGCAWLAAVTGARGHSKRLGAGGGSVHAAVTRRLCDEGYSVFADEGGGGGGRERLTRIAVSGVVVVRLAD